MNNLSIKALLIDSILIIIAQSRTNGPQPVHLNKNNKSIGQKQGTKVIPITSNESSSTNMIILT